MELFDAPIGPTIIDGNHTYDPFLEELDGAGKVANRDGVYYFPQDVTRLVVTQEYASPPHTHLPMLFQIEEKSISSQTKNIARGIPTLSQTIVYPNALFPHFFRTIDGSLLPSPLQYCNNNNETTQHISIFQITDPFLVDHFYCPPSVRYKRVEPFLPLNAGSFTYRCFVLSDAEQALLDGDYARLSSVLDSFYEDHRSRPTYDVVEEETGLGKWREICEPLIMKIRRNSWIHASSSWSRGTLSSSSSCFRDVGDDDEDLITGIQLAVFDAGESCLDPSSFVLCSRWNEEESKGEWEPIYAKLIEVDEEDNSGHHVISLPPLVDSLDNPCPHVGTYRMVVLRGGEEEKKIVAQCDFEIPQNRCKLILGPSQEEEAKKNELLMIEEAALGVFVASNVECSNVSYCVSIENLDPERSEMSKMQEEFSVALEYLNDHEITLETSENGLYVAQVELTDQISGEIHSSDRVPFSLGYSFDLEMRSFEDSLYSNSSKRIEPMGRLRSDPTHSFFDDRVVLTLTSSSPIPYALEDFKLQLYLRRRDNSYAPLPGEDPKYLEKWVYRGPIAIEEELIPSLEIDGSNVLYQILFRPDVYGLGEVKVEAEWMGRVVASQEFHIEMVTPEEMRALYESQGG